jgi:hypothetical protein
VTTGCAICMNYGSSECYFHLKVKSGLFKRKDAASNGYRKALDSRQWLIVGHDVDWQPDPNASPVDRMLGDDWLPARERSLVAKETAWLQHLGREDLNAEMDT